MNIILNLTTFN